MVVDRLSLQHAGSVVEVTAGEAITTHSLGFTDDSLGRLRKVSLVSFGGKRWGGDGGRSMEGVHMVGGVWRACICIPC